MKGSRVSIITIGDEILIGQVVDTNSAWLARQLNDIGMDVVEIHTISDQKGDIKLALDRVKSGSDLVILTGGLGPTKDDLTKRSLADYFNMPLVRNKEVENWVREIFSALKRDILEVNLQQADLPEHCEVLWNKLGTAPGMLFREEGKLFVSMPGVPYEMKHIFSERLLKILKEEFNTGEIIHRTLMTAGMGESFIAEKIADIEDSMPESVKLAYLPRPGMVRLRLSARGRNRISLLNDIESVASRISARLGKHHYGYDEISIEEAVGNKLRERGESLATAESCTGGNIARMITSVPGSSDYFLGSVVSYSNEVKSNVLDVREESLKEHGAVSEQVVKEMAEGLKNLIGATYSISVSGVAGPGGGTDEKPVGMVWLCIRAGDQVKTRLLNFGGQRKQIIERSSRLALYSLWTMIIDREHQE